jgi:hypothetical protein
MTKLTCECHPVPSLGEQVTVSYSTLPSRHKTLKTVAPPFVAPSLLLAPKTKNNGSSSMLNHTINTEHGRYAAGRELWTLSNDYRHHFAEHLIWLQRSETSWIFDAKWTRGGRSVVPKRWMCTLSTAATTGPTWNWTGLLKFHLLSTTTKTDHLHTAGQPSFSHCFHKVSRHIL